MCRGREGEDDSRVDEQDARQWVREERRAAAPDQVRPDRTAREVRADRGSARGDRAAWILAGFVLVLVVLFGGGDGRKYHLLFENGGQLVSGNEVLVGGPADRHGRRHHAHRRRAGRGRRSRSTSRCTRAPPPSSARPRCRGSPTATSRSRRDRTTRPSCPTARRWPATRRPRRSTSTSSSTPSHRRPGTGCATSSRVRRPSTTATPRGAGHLQVLRARPLRRPSACSPS